MLHAFIVYLPQNIMFAMYALQFYLLLLLKSRLVARLSLQTVVWQGGAAVKLRQDENIGRNIRAMRIASHMTQEQVVAKLQLAGCDISRSIYSQIESGTYNIRISQLVALKNLFHVEYNDFFSGLDDNV